MLKCAHAWLLGKYPLGICIRNPVFVDGRDTLNLFDLDTCCACSSCCRAGPPALISEQILIYFLRVYPRKPVVLCVVLPDFGLDNLLNVIDLGDLSFLFALERETSKEVFV